MSNNQLICVAPDKVSYFWPRVVKLIERALIRGHSDYDTAYVFHKVRLGESLLWVVWDGAHLVAAATTEICSLNGSGRVMVITTLGCRGVRVWREFREDLESYARNEKCDRVRLYGRPGWQRVLRDDGYVMPWVALEKRIG